MIYLYFLTFAIFGIVDYIYIYIYLDSKFLLNKTGSKLNRYLNIDRCSNNVKNKNLFIKVFSKNKFLFFEITLTMIILMLIINVIIFYPITSSKIVIVNLGYKKLELVSAFDKYWDWFKVGYNVLNFIFLIIIVPPQVAYYINKFYKNIGFNSEEDSSLIYNANNIYIGKTNQGRKVYIKERGLYQNILITGSIGSGKTSGAINTICEQLMKQKLGGIILDVKGNYVETVEKMARKTGRTEELIIITENNHIKYNPLRNDIKEIELAARLKQVISIISPSNSSDSYWLDKVENVLFNLIILIKKYNNDRLDFREIHLLITDNFYLTSKIASVKDDIRKKGVDDKTAYELSNVFLFFEKEYLNLDNRVLSIIKSEITRITIPFITDFEMYMRFGKHNDDSIKIDLKNSKGSIYVLSINVSNNMILAKMLSTFLKLDFQKEVLSNISNPNRVFCICDEYQEISNFEDAHFLSLSREAKCINILSMQSYSSLVNALNSEKTALVIIQNLVNKIWFRNDDNYTVSEAIKQIGKEKQILTTKSISEGSQETKVSVVTKKFKNKKSNLSQTLSYAESKDNIYEQNAFTRELKTFEAMVFLSDGNEIEQIEKIKFERWEG